MLSIPPGEFYTVQTESDKEHWCCSAGLFRLYALYQFVSTVKYDKGSSKHVKLLMH